MQTVEVKIARIGNSRDVRIPAEVLRRYAFTDTAVMVESVDGVLLRPKRKTDEKLSWGDTAKAMAAASEDWSARPLSKKRLGRKLGALSERDAATLRRVITEMYGE